jgi:hypothetical protein
MIEYNQYIELIYLVLDGEASDIERTALFSAMSENSALQNEFQTAMKLNKAAESFPATAKVPASLTEKFFNHAGMTFIPNESPVAPSIAACAVSAGTKSSIFSNAANFAFGKFGFAVLGLFVGAGLMYMINNNSTEKNNNIAAIPKINQSLFSDNQAKIPIMISENRNVISSKNTDTKRKSFQSNNSKNNENIADDFKLPVIEEAKSDILINNQEIIYSNISQEKDQIKFPNSSKSFDLIKNNSEIIDNNIYQINDFGLLAEIRHSAYWNLPKETIYPSEISKMLNMDLFIYYKINPNLLIGAGVRQETFYVKYNTKENLNREFIYEQQPNLTNYELAVRYLPFDGKSFNPLVQINLGGGKFGYTYRGALGGELKLYDNLTFVITADYATFLYIHRNELNYANKFGFNYGINFKL